MIINGKTYEGKNISIEHGEVYIDNVLLSDITDTNEKTIIINVSGDVNNIITDNANVTCDNVSGYVESKNGDISAIDIHGNVSTHNGDIKCSNINGTVRTVNGDIYN